MMDTELTPAQYWEAQASMWHENYKEAADEIERLRKALQQIANIDYRGPMPDGVAIARKALWEKD
jgi:hypothetical protein